MSEVPTFAYTPENSFESTMSKSSFPFWAKLPESHDSFYKLLGLGLLHHGTFSGYNGNHTHEAWILCNEEIMSYRNCYLTLSEDNNPEFWDGLKQATITEGSKAVRYAQSVPGLHKLRAGHMPNMSETSLVCKLAESLGIVLVWYEEVESEMTTKWFHVEEVEDQAVFYVCMGKYERNLYLFVHKSLCESPSGDIEGFPFYSLTGKGFIKPVLIGERLQYDESQAYGNGFLAFMVNTLIAVITSVPIEAIPSPYLARMGELGKQWKTMETQLKRSTAGQGLNFKGCEEMLQRFLQAPPASIPALPLDSTPHNVHHCVSDPNRYPDIRTFGKQQYHVHCLREYILDLSQQGEPLNWPKVPLPIPEEVIQEIAPELGQQHDAVVAKYVIRQ